MVVCPTIRVYAQRSVGLLDVFGYRVRMRMIDTNDELLGHFRPLVRDEK